MSNIELYNEQVFEDIKHYDELGNEYWLARELAPHSGIQAMETI